MIHYARTVTFANTGDIAATETEPANLGAAHQAVPESRMLLNKTCQDILKVTEAMIFGEIDYKKGNREA